MNNRSILKNFLYKITVEILRIIMPIITVPYIYRIFSPEIMGKIEFSQSISGYFFIFVGFGAYRYGLREISRVRDDEVKRSKVFSELFTIAILTTLITFIGYLGYVFYKFNSDILMKNLLLLNSIQIFSYFFFLEWINEAFENYKFISLKSLGIKVINFILIFIIIKNSKDFYKYLFMINIFIFLNNIISFIYIIKVQKYVKFKFKDLELKKYFFPLFTLVCISNTNIFYTQLDKLMLGFYVNDMKEIAYYGIAQKVMSILMVLIMALIGVSMPRLSYYLGNEDKNKYEELLNNLFPYIYMFLFPISIGIIILNKEIIYFFGGKEYLEAQLTIIVFGLRIVELVIESILSNQVIFLHKKEKVIVLLFGSFGLLNLIIKIILVKLGIYNSANAIFTTMLVEIGLVITEYLYIKRYLKVKIKVFNIKYFKYIICSLSFFLVKLFFNSNEYNYILNMISVILICMVIYFTLLIILKDEQIMEIKNKVQEKLRERIK